MSTTPRTDAALYPMTGGVDIVWPDFARSLETELARLRAEVERLKKQIADDNRSYGCELRDPNGTIWEQAAKDHARAERAEAEIERWRDSNNRLRAEMESQAQRAERAEHLKTELHDLSLDLSTANHMIKLERDRANALQTRLNEIDGALRKLNLID